jgi:hypothetical protein
VKIKHANSPQPYGMKNAEVKAEKLNIKTGRERI